MQKTKKKYLFLYKYAEKLHKYTKYHGTVNYFFNP